MAKGGKFAALRDSQTSEHRDIHGSQNRERSKAGFQAKPWLPFVIGGIAGFFAFLVTWFFVSVIVIFFHYVSDVFHGKSSVTMMSVGDAMWAEFGWHVLVSALVGGIAFLIAYAYGKRSEFIRRRQKDTTDINQHDNDAKLQLVEEMQERYDYFPDLGAHSSVEVSSMLSHVMLNNHKSIKKVTMLQRAEKETDEYLEGEVMLTDDGEEMTQVVEMFDKKMGEELFDASGLTKEFSKYRKWYKPNKIVYNPNNTVREKQKDCETVADLINKDWTLPTYEPQRPAGAYLVDTSPTSTMILAMTRAGKGQTYIEPVIDMWLRENAKNNIICNDPKGELLRKFYVSATVRGYTVRQMNLINPSKTDIYNILGFAAECARVGDMQTAAQLVQNMADVFFPVESGGDSFFQKAAANTFMRAAYGLIDFFMERERVMRQQAVRTGKDPAILDTELDRMWGQVTLYNCYEMFVQLSSKTKKSPLTQLDDDVKSGKITEEEAEPLREQAERLEPLWKNEPQMDMLSLYFNATAMLPRNEIRKQAVNIHNSITAMAGSEKTIASVYGVALTSMSFFTDPTIAMLTSGAPSQNVDLGGFAFPRRMGVRFDMNYLIQNNQKGLIAVWSAYGDENFTENLGKDFVHNDAINISGWAMYYPKGIFPKEKAYIKLELRNPQSSMLVDVFYFEFEKNYQKNLAGRVYLKNAVTGEKTIRDGVLRERVRHDLVDKNGQKTARYHDQVRTFSQQKINAFGIGQLKPEKRDVPILVQSLVKYTEKPTAIFLVTPPHLMAYARIILIMIKQLTDVSFSSSYMTKSNQKPLVNNNFMLDELGNLQSDGAGIANLNTILSIGLGQGQKFTLILQTLQQLRDVYGETSDKIIQGNVGNIIFLKSTDDQMIETLSKMSGTVHRAYMSSKSYSEAAGKVGRSGEDARISYTTSLEEEPLVSMNDMFRLPERNSLVFRAGDDVIWNRNETVLPMSYKLHSNAIVNPGKEYDLQNIPTISTVGEFDVRKNMPNFLAMVEQRIEEAAHVEEATTMYNTAFQYTENDVIRLDPDLYANDIMEVVDGLVMNAKGLTEDESDEMPEEMKMNMNALDDDVYARNEELDEADDLVAELKDWQKKRYVQNRISRDNIARKEPDGSVHGYSNVFGEEFSQAISYSLHAIEADRQNFSVIDGSVYSADGKVLYAEHLDADNARAEEQKMQDATRDADGQIYSDSEGDHDVKNDWTYRIQPAFFEWLTTLPSWTHLAGGSFEHALDIEFGRKENTTLS